MVYRGCADSWNLPYYVEVKNCTGSEGTVWWFCTGSHCNRGTFGSDDVCPGSYDDQDDKSSDESSKSYGDDNQVYTRIDEDEGHDGIFDDIRYGGAYDELLYTYDSSDDTPAVAPGDGFDPYRILESGWQDYRNDLEPKSARDDDAYQEPVVPSAGVDNQHRYGTEEAYTYDPPLPVNFYPSAPALVNPLFEEHYRSLVPDPRAHTQNSFQPPVAPNIPTKKSSDHEKAKSWQPKSVNTPDAYHKSWEGDDFSVSYNTRTGQNSEHVKSAYAYTDHSKSGYVQPGKSVKSHQPVKSGYIDMSADNGQTRNGYQPPKSMKSHVPVKSHPQKSMKSTPPSKSGYIPSPLKSVKSEPYVKSAGPHYKSVPVPLPLPVPPPSKEYEPSKSYQPSKKSHQPPPKSYEPPTKSQPPKKSYQPPPKSYEPKKYHIPAPKSLEAPSKSYMPPQKSYKPPKKSHIPPPKSYEPPKKSHIPPPKSYEPPTKSHIPPPKSYESPKKSYIPPPKSYEPPKKSYIPPPKSYEPPKKSHIPPPKKSHIPPSKSYEAPKKSHIPPPKSYELPQKSHTVTKNVVVDAPSLPIRHVPLLPLQPLLPLAGPVHDVILPDYKSSDFGDFWYEHYYRGDKMHEPGKMKEFLIFLQPVNLIDKVSDMILSFLNSLNSKQYFQISYILYGGALNVPEIF